MIIYLSYRQVIYEIAKVWFLLRLSNMKYLSTLVKPKAHIPYSSSFNSSETIYVSQNPIFGSTCRDIVADGVLFYFL